MKSAILCFGMSMMLSLAACSTQIGGDGQMSSGEPLSVVMQVDVTATASVTVIDIVSLEGWRCTTRIDSKDVQPGIRHSHPMQCSNGLTGTMILTWDTFQDRQHGAFRLSNGKSGKVTFDFKG